MTLRWRKDPPERGLARVCAGPRGSGLYIDKTIKAASVCALRGGGWFWVAGWDTKIPYKNTCETPVTEAEAKIAAMKYVKEHLST